MRKIGLLVTGHVRDELVEKHGEYGAFFERFLGFDTFDYRHYFVVDGALPEKVHACDGYLITGSQHGVYEDHAFIEPLEAFIRETYCYKVPLAGICFGHQIMAQALGGKVEKFVGGWGLGGHDYSIDMGTGPERLRLHAVHQDQVVEVPEGAEIIGSSPFCRIAALRYPGKAVSFQPHPEFDAEFVRDLIALRRGLNFSNSVADIALESLGQPVANQRIRDYIRDFFML